MPAADASASRATTAATATFISGAARSLALIYRKIRRIATKARSPTHADSIMITNARPQIAGSVDRCAATVAPSAT
jgi:hypothetical protein